MRWQFATQSDTVFTDVNCGIVFRQSFVEPRWKPEAVSPQNQMCILVCGYAKLTSSHGDHHNIGSVACAYKIAVGCGAKPVRLIFTVGTKSDDPDRRFTVKLLLGLLQEERAQLLEP